MPELNPDIHPSAKAVKQAIISHDPRRLITENLDAEFRTAVQQKNDVGYIASQLTQVLGTGAGIKKFSANGMKRVGSSFTINRGMSRSANFTADRVFDVPHNPFRSRQAIETPQNLVELYQRFRFYFQREPLVGTAIELHSEFPLSQFQLTHEDPVLQEEFNDIAEDLNLFEFQIDMAMEYYLIGECFPFGIFDDPAQPSMWKNFILLNPLNIEIANAPITDGRGSQVIKLRIDEVLKTIIKNGAKDKITGKLFDRIPEDIKHSVKKGDGTIVLNEVQVSHFKRKGNYFKVRGESMLYRIIHLLSYRDKMRDAQYSICDRNVTPREVWKLGETGNPASEDELQAFSDMLSSTYLDPNQAIVGHHAISVDVISGGDKLMPLRQELDGVESEMLTGLMLNKGFLDSSYGAYANMSVALDVLIARYLTFRQRMERWQREHVWAPLCRIHGIYKPTQAEISHRIRIKDANKRPWTPSIQWDKQELKDPSQKINLMMMLRDKLGKPGFPKDLIYQTLNYNPRSIKQMLSKEAKEETIKGNAGVQLNKGPGAGLGDLSMDQGAMGGESLNIPGGSGGGAGGGPTGEKLPDNTNLPEFNAGGSSTQLDKTMPPSSQKIQNDKTPPR